MKPDLEQEKAAKYMHGDSLIIAGAGSGKTTTLLLKVKYLINSGIKENEILVISFTNETVNNFKKKCEFDITVLTFHKLASTIIKSNKEIVEDDFLNQCIINYLNFVPEKLKRKIYLIFIDMFFSKIKYEENIESLNASSISSFFSSTIKQIKANMIDLNNIDITRFSSNERIILYCIKNIINYYNKELLENNFIDFDTMILEATNIIKKKLFKHNYKHILIDEYQDISQIRLNFLKSFAKVNNSIITAVGDDFQSIYGFSGSNIDLFYDFKKHYQNSKTFYIHTSYRCPQKIVKKAGKFIMKNPMQIKKNIISNNNIKGKIIKIYARSYKHELCKIINKYKTTNHTILILGRNNFDINFLLDNNIKIDDSYIIYNNKKLNNIRYLTVHKAKGLEADITVIINLASGRFGFPSLDTNNLLNKLIVKKENFPLAEERRLFYVALTRCKIKTYLIINRRQPSEFIKEI